MWADVNLGGGTIERSVLVISASQLILVTTLQSNPTTGSKEPSNQKQRVPLRNHPVAAGRKVPRNPKHRKEVGMAESLG